MKLDLNIWLDYRRKASVISRRLKEFHFDGGRFGSDEWNDLADELLCITKQCAHYLDSVGAYLPPAKWKYNSDDQTTWKSHRDFSYGNLV